MKTLTDHFAEIAADLLEQRYNSETLMGALREAQTEFIGAVSSGDMETLHRVGNMIYDGTEALERLFSSDEQVMQWVRPLVAIANLAQRLYEIMKPKIEAEKLLETSLGRRIIRSLYDREISWIDLKCELGADHYEFTDAMRTLVSGHLIAYDRPSGDEQDIRKFSCRLRREGRNAAEKMFPELKLSLD